MDWLFFADCASTSLQVFQSAETRGSTVLRRASKKQCKVYTPGPVVPPKLKCVQGNESMTDRRGRDSSAIANWACDNKFKGEKYDKCVCHRQHTRLSLPRRSEGRRISTRVPTPQLDQREISIRSPFGFRFLFPSSSDEASSPATGMLSSIPLNEATY